VQINDLAETLTNSEKLQLANDMKNLLERIEENDENIKTYFPENPKFKEEAAIQRLFFFINEK
jgi:hypothetical protein